MDRVIVGFAEMELIMAFWWRAGWVGKLAVWTALAQGIGGLAAMDIDIFSPQAAAARRLPLDALAAPHKQELHFLPREYQAVVKQLMREFDEDLALLRRRAHVNDLARLEESLCDVYKGRRDRLDHGWADKKQYHEEQLSKIDLTTPAAGAEDYFALARGLLAMELEHDDSPAALSSEQAALKIPSFEIEGSAETKFDCYVHQLFSYLLFLRHLPNQIQANVKARRLFGQRLCECHEPVAAALVALSSHPNWWHQLPGAFLALGLCTRRFSQWHRGLMRRCHPKLFDELFALVPHEDCKLCKLR